MVSPSNTLVRHDDQELLGNDIQEVMRYRPHWLVRHGNTVLACVALLGLSFAWMIRYPDIVEASAKLVAVNPPRQVTARVAGKLTRLLVANNQLVRQGQHLGTIESTVDYDQVLRLQAWIDTVASAVVRGAPGIILAHPAPQLQNLGDLQARYQDLQTELAQTRETLANGYYEHKQAMLRHDLDVLGRLRASTRRQAELAEQDRRLAMNEFRAYESLAGQRAISAVELNQYQSKLLAKEQSVQQYQSQLSTSDVNIASKEQELRDLGKTVSEQRQRLSSLVFDMKSQIDGWIQQYVLVSPDDGTVSFISSLQEKELLDVGQPLFYIQPKQSQLYAEVMAAQRGFGRVRSGQRVMIKIESYPSDEFGYIDGQVEEIANLANRRDSFFVKVRLPHGLRTSYQRDIAFKNGLSGQAQIVTDNRKLSDRLLGQLYQLWNR